jgi:mRNA-degrading endonuclease toxin of MazEF toxin-antitoxin module
VKNLDWKVRRGRFVGRMPDAVVEEVLGKLLTLLGK